jgi:o-succinylbenzoate synthase
MALRASYAKKDLQFNFKARTSRGLMKDKTSWFIKLWDDADPTCYGIGECSPLPGLSVDATPDYEDILVNTLRRLCNAGFPSSPPPGIPDVSDVVGHGLPSISFGLETALLDLANGGTRIIFKNNFLAGRQLPINGLIWMGDMDFMMDQINKKISAGFKCIKLKVGGLDFDRECDVLNYIRKRYFRNDTVIRLDANGAFRPDDVLYRLDQLARFNIHSIEQPIKPGSSFMEELCRKSPIPVAFDEELIGVEKRDDKIRLLETLRPAFVILKPSLHGGLSGTAEWIALAEHRNIGWWITSALESSIGLNAIAQFTARYSTDLYQGLGTGGIYRNNIESPLNVVNGNLAYDIGGRWIIDDLSFGEPV